MSFELFLGEALFRDAPLWAVACIAVSCFLGFFIRGAFGFGSNIPIVLLTTPILGPHHAIVPDRAVEPAHAIRQAIRNHTMFRCSIPVMTFLSRASLLFSLMFSRSSLTESAFLSASS